MFINDGFTLRATIRARGPFKEMPITYRLAAPERVYEWRELREACKDARKRWKIDAAFACEHVLEWDGEKAIVPESLKKVAPFVLPELIDYITGYTFDEAATSEGNS